MLSFAHLLGVLLFSCVYAQERGAAYTRAHLNLLISQHARLADDRCACAAYSSRGETGERADDAHPGPGSHRRVSAPPSPAPGPPRRGPPPGGGGGGGKETLTRRCRLGQLTPGYKCIRSSCPGRVQRVPDVLRRRTACTSAEVSYLASCTSTLEHVNICTAHSERLATVLRLLASDAMITCTAYRRHLITLCREIERSFTRP